MIMMPCLCTVKWRSSATDLFLCSSNFNVLQRLQQSTLGSSPKNFSQMIADIAPARTLFFCQKERWQSGAILVSRRVGQPQKSSLKVCQAQPESLYSRNTSEYRFFRSTWSQPQRYPYQKESFHKVFLSMFLFSWRKWGTGKVGDAAWVVWGWRSLEYWRRCAKCLSKSRSIN